MRIAIGHLSAVNTAERTETLTQAATCLAYVEESLGVNAPDAIQPGRLRQSAISTSACEGPPVAPRKFHEPSFSTIETPDVALTRPGEIEDRVCCDYSALLQTPTV